MRALGKYEHILFDLDHTLWDYESNSRQALQELFDKYDLNRIDGLTSEKFVERFFLVNESLWEKYDQHEISSEELRGSRFHLILNEYGLTSDEMMAPDDRPRCGQRSRPPVTSIVRGPRPLGGHARRGV